LETFVGVIVALSRSIALIGFGEDTVSELEWLSSKLVEMGRLSLLIEVEEGLGRRSAVAEAILWAEQETEIIMFMISCLLLANYKSLQL
jgi:hypothetical protein